MRGSVISTTSLLIPSIGIPLFSSPPPLSSCGSYRKRGIGQLFVKALLKHCRDLCVSRFILTSTEAGTGLYKRFGFDAPHNGYLTLEALHNDYIKHIDGKCLCYLPPSLSSLFSSSSLCYNPLLPFPPPLPIFPPIPSSLLLST